MNLVLLDRTIYVLLFINGEIYYDKDSIRIKINRVKAGPFKVTGTFFKEIKKQESDKLIVNRPWIEIPLDK